MSLPRSSRKQVISFTPVGTKPFRRKLAGLAASAAAVLLPHAGYGLTWDITPGDGAMITSDPGETLDEIAKRYELDPKGLRAANPGLKEKEKNNEKVLASGQSIFLLMANKNSPVFGELMGWALLGTIQRPSDYESDALTN